MVTKIEKKAADTRAISASEALLKFNQVEGTSWTFGDNWDNNNHPLFMKFINMYLFPKINETTNKTKALGNKFESIAVEKDYIGEFSEEYVIKDSVPVNMDLSQEAELMLKRNYPQMITKFYGTGIVKKQKFTLNNNEMRLNFSTIGQATAFALNVYKKKISDINNVEEKEIKCMLVDYALNHAVDKRSVNSMQELVDETMHAFLNLQSNSSRHNEFQTASNGLGGEYTTVSDPTQLQILTSDRVKHFILNTSIGNTFQIAGLDPTNSIISFDDLGGVYRALVDITISDQNTINVFQAYGDYQIKMGNIITKGSTIPFNVSNVAEFQGKIEEIKPSSPLFSLIYDCQTLSYERCTKNMVKAPFDNGEFDEVTYWIHYYSRKYVSPFDNKVTVYGDV